MVIPIVFMESDQILNALALALPVIFDNYHLTIELGSVMCQRVAHAALSDFWLLLSSATFSDGLFYHRIYSS